MTCTVCPTGGAVNEDVNSKHYCDFCAIPANDQRSSNPAFVCMCSELSNLYECSCAAGYKGDGTTCIACNAYVDGVQDLNADLQCRIAGSGFFWDAALTITQSSASTRLYSAAVVDRKGSVFFVPFNADNVARMTLLMKPNDTPDPEWIAMTLSSNYVSHANPAKYSAGVLATNGKIYLAPSASTVITVINSIGNTPTLEYIAMPTDQPGQVDKYSSVVTGTDHQVYFIPYTANKIAVLDTATSVVTLFSSPSVTTDPQKWSDGVLAGNGAIYFIPYNIAEIGKFQPLSSYTFSTIDISSYLPENTVPRYKGAFISDSTLIYFVPYSGGKLGVLDTTTDTFSLIHDGPELQGNAYYGGVMTPSGFIHLMPSGTKQMAIFDTRTHAFASVALPVVRVVPPMTLAPDRPFPFLGGVLLNGGRILFIPEEPILYLLFRHSPLCNNCAHCRIEDCRENTYGYNMSNVHQCCTPCPENSISGGMASALSECKCRSGSYGVYAASEPHTWHSCTDCVPGKYLLTTEGVLATNCQDCPAGTWSSTVSADSNQTCIPCSAGKKSSFVAATSETTCAHCDAGAYSSTSAVECTPCLAGTYSSTSAANCTWCLPGSYSLAGAAVCTPCPFNSLTTSAVLDSPAVCLCNAGYSMHEPTASVPMLCVACTIGKYKREPGNTACAACEVAQNQFSVHVGAQECQTCAQGKFAQTPSTCAFCAVGMYLQSNYVCAQCQAYGTRYRLQLFAERESIFPGEGDLSAIQASQLDPLRYKEHLCAGCECGVFRDALGIEIPDTCTSTVNASRQYLDGSSRQCEACPRHRQIIRDARRRSCEEYNVTHTQRQARTWNDETQLYQCIAGYYSLSQDHTWTSTPSCIACPVGKYAPLQNGVVCTDCPRNLTTQTSASIDVEECMYCATNHRTSYDNLNRSCSTCGAMKCDLVVANIACLARVLCVSCPVCSK